MALGLIDIGGTSIKFGIWKDHKIIEKEAIPTPNDLTSFYKELTKQMNIYKAKYNIKSIGVSAPGTVDQRNGIIKGASAIPYIHNFKIVDELETQIGLPIKIENDANCAALAELKYGAARGKQNVVLLVLGSGVGGSVIVNKQIYRGSHLLGGEFGYMLADETRTVSQVATVVEMAKRYSKKKKAKKLYDGKMVFEDAKNGDTIARQYVNSFYYELAKIIFNLQYSFDPDVFLIGGGISNNPMLLKGIEKGLDAVMQRVPIAEVRPTVKVCKFHADANLIGAAVNTGRKQND